MQVVAILNRNTRLGSPSEIAARLRARLNGALMDVRVPGSAREACEAAEEAVSAGANVVLAAGGDGTMNAAINGIAGSEASLAVLPRGTANDLAAIHALPTRLEDVCEDLLSGRTERIDLISVNGWRYATDGGIGLCCSVADVAETLRRKTAVRRCL